MQAVTGLQLQHAAPGGGEQLIGRIAELSLIAAGPRRPQSAQTLRIGVEFVLQPRRLRAMLTVNQQRVLLVRQEDAPRVKVVRQVLAARREPHGGCLQRDRESARLDALDRQLAHGIALGRRTRGTCYFGGRGSGRGCDGRLLLCGWPEVDVQPVTVQLVARAVHVVADDVDAILKRGERLLKIEAERALTGDVYFVAAEWRRRQSGRLGG